ncbi:hypothetical protein A2U01_0111067, partial [Trifolium medium]|nr:hypothetical protein [Trifolium medium]
IACSIAGVCRCRSGGAFTAVGVVWNHPICWGLLCCFESDGEGLVSFQTAVVVFGGCSRSLIL